MTKLFAAGLWQRFRAMHRWWIVLALVLFTIVGGVPVDGYAESRILPALMATAILWPALTGLIVLIPKLRGAVVLGPAIAALLGLFDIGGSWVTFAMIFGVLFLMILGLGRLPVTLTLKAVVDIDRPAHEVQQIVRLRATGAYWNPIVERIEPHPEVPNRWRCFLVAPINRHIPYFDAEAGEVDAEGWRLTRIIPAEQTMWRGSETLMLIEPRDGGCRVAQVERSQANALAAIAFWFDRVSTDILGQLKAYAEGRTDWSISSGSLRWWPTWRPAPDAAHF